MVQGNCLFPVIEEKEQEEEEVEEEEDKITTAMQSPQQCSRVVLMCHGNCFFPSEQGG